MNPNGEQTLRFVTAAPSPRDLQNLFRGRRREGERSAWSPLTTEEHVLLRTFGASLMLYECVQWARQIQHISEPFQVLAWCYAAQSADALRTAVESLAVEYSWAVSALLRTCRESQIAVKWLLSAETTEEKNERAARLVTKAKALLARKKTLPFAVTAVENVDKIFKKLGLSAYAQANPAPDVRRMADEAKESQLYDGFSLWSTETHVGMGSILRVSTLSTSSILLRSEALIYAIEDVRNTLSSLLPTIDLADQQLFVNALASFNGIYYKPAQEAFWSALYSSFDIPGKERRELYKQLESFNPLPLEMRSIQPISGVSVVRFEVEGVGGTSIHVRNCTEDTIGDFRVGCGLVNPRRWWHFGTESLLIKDGFTHVWQTVLPEQSTFVTLPNRPPITCNPNIIGTKGRCFRVALKPISSLYLSPVNDVMLILPAAKDATAKRVLQPGPVW